MNTREADVSSSWSGIWERWLGRFETLEVSSAEERQACIGLLGPGSRREWTALFGPRVFSDDAPVDAAAQWIVIRERRSGRVVGGARTVGLERLDTDEAVVDLVADRISADMWPAVRVCTSLSLDPRFRNGAAAWTLLERIVAEAYQHDARLLVLSCEPSQLPLYLDAGFRPLAPLRGAPSGGFRIPLVLVLHDRVHLEDVRSPLRTVLRKQPSPLPVEGLHWLFRHLAKYEAEDLGVAWAPRGTELPYALVDGMSAAGRRALLHRAYRARCQPGQRITAQDGPNLLGVVECGHVRVVVDGRDTVRLGVGKVFGAMGVLRGGYSAVEIIAEPGAEVLILSERPWPSALGPGDRDTLERNLTRLASDRTHLLNRSRMGHGAQGPQPATSVRTPTPRSRRPSWAE